MMKKTFSTISTTTVIFLLTVFLFSCSNDNEITQGGEELTTAQAMTSVAELSASAETDIVEMLQSDGTNAITDLLDLLSESDDPFGGRIISDRDYNNSLFKTKLLDFKQVFVPKQKIELQSKTDDDRFDFQTSTGIYNWVADLNDFVKTDDVVDFIQMNFPTNGSSTNNAILTLLDYQDRAIDDDGFIEYYPTVIVGNIKVDDVLLVSLTLEASYHDNGDPKVGDVLMFVTPFDYHLNLQNADNIASTLSASISRDSTPILNTEVDVAFKTAAKEEVSILRGEVTYRTHSIKGTLDVTGVEEVENSGTGDINEFINLALYENMSKVGDIILVENNQAAVDEDEYQLYVQYDDGSRELLEDVLEPVIVELEDFVTELEGED